MPVEPAPGVTWRERDVKSVLLVRSATDAWFVAPYGLNLYRGCEHGCAYCDGRAEKYHVEGDFARDIVVKRNALDLVPRELDRLPEPGFLFVGGGVSDSWQPAEVRYRLARGVLELALDRGIPVHVLTKSALVERDLDLLERIAARSRAILCFSIQTVDEGLRQAMEPGAAPLETRWRILRDARARGIATGVMASPVLPGLSDTPEAIDALVARAAAEGVRFVLGSGLTLRPGVQKDAMFAAVARIRPDLLPGYEKVYRSDRQSGVANPIYYQRVAARFKQALARHAMPAVLPLDVWRGFVPRYVEVALRLDHEVGFLDDGTPRARHLWDAASTLLTWAHARRLARRGPERWRDVERELWDHVRRGDVSRHIQVDPRAIPFIERFTREAGAPAPETQGQLF